MIEVHRSVVISLARRPERLRAFRAAWPDPSPLPTPQDFPAVDGRATERPAWFHESPGAWGCLRSHLRVIEDCLTNGWDSVAVFEDDCLFAQDFAARCAEFLAAVPDDWEQVYLGGQHLVRPAPVGPLVLRGTNVNRTHAYILRGGDAARKVYRHLAGASHRTKAHVDHWLGELHQSGTVRAYCPVHWLCGQAAGVSDIKDSQPNRPEGWWQC